MGSASARGEAWACDQKLDLLFVGCLSLATMIVLWVLALDLSVGGSWVALHGKSELLAALLPCLATMIHAMCRVCAQSCRIGWLAARKPPFRISFG